MCICICICICICKCRCIRNRTGTYVTGASNFEEVGNVDDGSCRYDIYGCTVGESMNYDSTATVSTNCIEAVVGCLDTEANNFAPDANIARQEVLDKMTSLGYTFEELLEEFEYLGEEAYAVDLINQMQAGSAPLPSKAASPSPFLQAKNAPLTYTAASPSTFLQDATYA